MLELIFSLAFVEILKNKQILLNVDINLDFSLHEHLNNNIFSLKLVIVAHGLKNRFKSLKAESQKFLDPVLSKP